MGILLRSYDHVQDDDVGKRSPLAGYAAEHWVSHAQFERVSLSLRKAMEYLFDGLGTTGFTMIDYASITVSFYANSRLTHSTSHTSLPISLTSTDHEHTQPTTGSLFRGPRRRLAVGLAVALALLGGLLVLGLLLAALRCFVRPPDPALTGEAAAHAMTESDRQWYGIGDMDQAEDMGNNTEKGARLML